MRRLFITASLLTVLCTSRLSAQSAMQVSYIVPAKGLEYLYKRTVGVEFLMMGFGIDDENKFGFGASGGFYYFKPTAPAFNTVTYTNAAGRGPLIGSTKSVNRVIMIPLSVVTEYRFLKGKIFTPIAGLDLNLNLVDYSGTHIIPGVISEGEEIFGATVGLTPRAGVTWFIKQDMNLTAHFGRELGITGMEIEPQTYNKSLLRLMYSF
jgi:hypothetical protein